VRGSGNQIFIDLQVAVPRHLSFEESHAVTDNVESAVRTISPSADVVVISVPTAENEGLFERIQAVAERGHFDVHNITTHKTKQGVWIDLDLEVKPDISFERAHAMATDLESQLRAELANAQDTMWGSIADINVHIEPVAEELVEGTDLPARDAVKYLERIKLIAKAIPHVHGMQDVAIQRLDGGIYLSLHLQIDSDQSVAEVHSISEEMENRLRREFPQLGRVMIHAEPQRESKPKQAAR
jgi:divalent metal cation (Fe/Co/Zn/Cd) transporter